MYNISLSKIFRSRLQWRYAALRVVWLRVIYNNSNNSVALCPLISHWQYGVIMHYYDCTWNEIICGNSKLIQCAFGMISKVFILENLINRHDIYIYIYCRPRFSDIRISFKSDGTILLYTLYYRNTVDDGMRGGYAVRSSRGFVTYIMKFSYWVCYASR